jgi:hypothetical protein
MRQSLLGRLVPVLGLAAAAALVPVTLMLALGTRMVMVPMVAHFLVVLVAGSVAFAAAVVLTVVGARRRDGRTLIVATALSVMAGMLVVHALATPTIIVGENGLVQFAGAGNIPAGAAILGLLSLPAFRRPKHIGRLLGLQAALLAGVAALGGAGLLWPGLIPVMPGPGGTPALVVVAAGLLLLAPLEYRTARTYLLTRRPRDLAVAVGVVFLGCALTGLLTLGYTEVGFWIAHGLEVAGVALVGLPAAFDLYSSSRLSPLTGDLAADRLVSQEEAFLGSRVRSLMLRLADKDGSTETHTRRVSLLAMRVGERLGLSPARLRTLAVGGLLHDIGKLTVPDAILKKPGALDDGEFAVIKRHPGWGDELLNELGGFPTTVRRLVLDHHERLDGRGYPRGLAADDIALETRILTVCDVYDALVSERVYREAWPHERAMSLLRGDVGTAFDSLCVEALEDVVAGERGAELSTAA